MKRILIIEDDPAISAGLKALLELESFNVDVKADGTEGYEIAKTQSYNLIVLDLMLPGKDGISICKDLRNKGVNTPILMVTSKKEEIDKVLGLEFGADDYVTKPFSNRELVARVHALLRRESRQIDEQNVYVFSNLKIDFIKHEAWKNEIPVQMSSMEFKLLKYFINHQGEVVNRDSLLDEVWGYDAFPTTRTVDNYILSLRKKLEDDPSNPKHLMTVYKAGYKFNP